jgi:ATP-dependent Lhr-like helicase
LQPLPNIDSYISELLQSSPALLDFSKWGIYLPEKYKIALLKSRYFDIEQTRELLGKLRLINNQ